MSTQLAHRWGLLADRDFGLDSRDVDVIFRIRTVSSHLVADKDSSFVTGHDLRFLIAIANLSLLLNITPYVGFDLPNGYRSIVISISISP